MHNYTKHQLDFPIAATVKIVLPTGRQLNNNFALLHVANIVAIVAAGIAVAYVAV